jgi:hypothetical protein
MTTNRRAGAVSAAALSGLAAIFGLAQFVAPAWAASLGLDVWNVPSFRESLRRSEAERRALAAQEERLLREMEAARHVAVRLAEGAVTLDGATDELEPLLATRPGFNVTCGAAYGSTTFRQGVARYLMSRVEQLLAEDPDRLAAVYCRLEGEYASLR